MNIKKYYYKSNENIKCNNFELTNEIEYKKCINSERINDNIKKYFYEI